MRRRRPGYNAMLAEPYQRRVRNGGTVCAAILAGGAFVLKELLMTRIDQREDVSPKEGLREYGDVEFADPVNNKYPIDSEEHVRAAWSYINHADNAAKYDKDEVKQIKNRIKAAAKKYDIEIETS
jgi:hypothetical protein